MKSSFVGDYFQLYINTYLLLWSVFTAAGEVRSSQNELQCVFMVMMEYVSPRTEWLIDVFLIELA